MTICIGSARAVRDDVILMGLGEKIEPLQSRARNARGAHVMQNNIVLYPDPTLSREEKGLVNLGRILGPLLRNFHAPRLVM